MADKDDARSEGEVVATYSAPQASNHAAPYRTDLGTYTANVPGDQAPERFLYADDLVKIFGKA